MATAVCVTYKRPVISAIEILCGECRCQFVVRVEQIKTKLTQIILVLECFKIS